MSEQNERYMPIWIYVPLGAVLSLLFSMIVNLPFMSGIDKGLGVRFGLYIAIFGAVHGALTGLMIAVFKLGGLGSSLCSMIILFLIWIGIIAVSVTQAIASTANFPQPDIPPSPVTLGLVLFISSFFLFVLNMVPAIFVGPTTLGLGKRIAKTI